MYQAENLRNRIKDIGSIEEYYKFKKSLNDSSRDNYMNSSKNMRVFSNNKILESKYTEKSNNFCENSFDRSNNNEMGNFFYPKENREFLKNNNFSRKASFESRTFLNRNIEESLNKLRKNFVTSQKKNSFVNLLSDVDILIEKATKSDNKLINFPNGKSHKYMDNNDVRNYLKDLDKRFWGKEKSIEKKVDDKNQQKISPKKKIILNHKKEKNENKDSEDLSNDFSLESIEDQENKVEKEEIYIEESLKKSEKIKIDSEKSFGDQQKNSSFSISLEEEKKEEEEEEIKEENMVEEKKGEFYNQEENEQNKILVKNDILKNSELKNLDKSNSLKKNFTGLKSSKINEKKLDEEMINYEIITEDNKEANKEEIKEEIKETLNELSKKENLKKSILNSKIKEKFISLENSCLINNSEVSNEKSSKEFSEEEHLISSQISEKTINYLQNKYGCKVQNKIEDQKIIKNNNEKNNEVNEIFCMNCEEFIEISKVDSHSKNCGFEKNKNFLKQEKMVKWIYLTQKLKVF